MSPLLHSIPRPPAPSEFPLHISAEAIAKYRPGGYHPVRLGDYFKDGQYKVINKLGYGGFATVWFARDIRYVKITGASESHASIPNRAHRNVSPKVVVAEKSGALQTKLRILKHLKRVTNMFTTYLTSSTTTGQTAGIFVSSLMFWVQVCFLCWSTIPGWTARGVTFRCRCYVQSITSIHPELPMGVSPFPLLNAATVDRLAKTSTPATSYSVSQDWIPFHLRTSSNQAWFGRMGSLPETVRYS